MSSCIFWEFLPSIALNNDPTDYENCKEHLPTHLIFTPLLHDFQPQHSNTKPDTSGDFTRPILYELTRV